MASEESYRFDEHIIKASVVFFRSKLSYGFVNIKPVVPGHVLVAPIRFVRRFCDLTEDEVADLFLSTQKISRVVEREFKATSLSIVMQDGPEAGHSVPHVHVQILPRRKGDFHNNDDVYEVLQTNNQRLVCKKGVMVADGPEIFRTEEEMSKEARQLAPFFKTDD